MSDGSIARLEESRGELGSWMLYINETPQSHVNTKDPEQLTFDYVRRIADAIDVAYKSGDAITALHLGGGGFTLPRYVEATRPGSRQQVIELEPALVELVRETIPFNRGASIRVRIGDAREVLSRLPAGLSGAVDIAVVDIFQGARTPAHVTSLEFYQLLKPLLAPNGIIAVNIADGGALSFAKSQIATLEHLYRHVGVAVDTSLLKGRRFGNVVAYASSIPMPFEEMPRRLASSNTPAKYFSGLELKQFLAGAKIVTDATAIQSPQPTKNIFTAR